MLEALAIGNRVHAKPWGDEQPIWIGIFTPNRWQSIPKMVVEKAEANLGRNIDPTKEGDQSDDSDFTEEEHVIPPRSRSRNAKRGRYGHAFSSSDSDNPNDMSDFIVDG